MSRIIIHVRGGVAQVTHTTDPVEVLLCDWDSIEADGADPKWQQLRASTPIEFGKELRDIENQVNEIRADLGLKD